MNFFSPDDREYTLEDFRDFDPIESLTEEFGFREEIDPETAKLVAQF